MLTSIHPLGERARHNRWGVTAAAFGVAAVATAGGIGAVLGGAGTALPPGMIRESVPIVGVAAILAALLDLWGRRPPGLRRQVNERWIGRYRGWVYGAGFGAQLGAGLATYVVTWTVWVVLLAELTAGSPAGGAVIGIAFGIGRAAPVAAARWIDRPSRLARAGRVMNRIGVPVGRAVAVLIIVAGAVTAGGGLG